MAELVWNVEWWGSHKKDGVLGKPKMVMSQGEEHPKLSDTLITITIVTSHKTNLHLLLLARMYHP